MPFHSAWCLWMPFEPSTLSWQQTSWQAVKTNLFWVQREVISILPRACESALNLAEFSLCPSKYCYRTLIHPYWSPQYSTKSPAREGKYLFVCLFAISEQPMKPPLRSDCTPVSVASLWLQPGSVRQKPFTGQGLLQPARNFPHEITTFHKHPALGKSRTNKDKWKLAEGVRQHPALGWWLKGHPKGEHPPPWASPSSGQWGTLTVQLCAHLPWGNSWNSSGSSAPGQ